MTGSCSYSRPQHLFWFFLFVPFLSLAQQYPENINGSIWNFPSNSLCSSQQNGFSTSQFSNNLKSLVSSIPSLPSNTYNFYNFSLGDQERVEATGLCNRVVPPVLCLNCITQAAVNLTTICPQHREAYIRATKCMFRYSDKPILGKLEKIPVLEAANPNNATGDRDEFISLQGELLNRLRNVAAAGGSMRKYAQGNGTGPLPNTRFFASVQCTPDLSEKDCNDCLNYGFGNATKGRLGIRWFCPSCSFQIESNLRFFPLEYEHDPPSEPGSVPAGPKTASGPEAITSSGSEPNAASKLGEYKLKIILGTIYSVVGLAIIVA